jgi:hypothetical protein
MRLLRVEPLPGDALAAAARFHAEVLPRALAECELGETLTLLFGPADHRHRAWRLAAIQGLSRHFAPVRVNGLASNDERAIAAALAYLETAEGVTGQLLRLDGNGAGEILSSSR